MKTCIAIALVLLAAGCASAPKAADQPEHGASTVTSMAGEPEWTQPHAPIRMYGDSYYVGTAGISSVLVSSDAGLVLLDVGMPQAAPLVEENIRALGFSVEDVKYVLTSHTHYDHVGGVASVVRDSGATAVSSPEGAASLRSGHVAPNDPQASDTANASFPAVQRVREIADGEALRLGNIAVTAHFTPGHTPGGVSWTWKSCEGDRCLDMVYADSLNPVAAGDFRIAPLEPQFRQSIQTMRELPCDIVISIHPEVTNVIGRLNKLAVQRDPNPLVGSDGCRAYADKFDGLLDERIAKEKSQR